MKIFWYVAVMAIVTYLIRAVPFVLFRKKVESPFLQKFFNYIPYAVLAAMTIPSVFGEGKNPLCAAAGFAVAVVSAFFERSLIFVAVISCLAAYLTGLI